MTNEKLKYCSICHQELEGTVFIKGPDEKVAICEDCIQTAYEILGLGPVQYNEANEVDDAMLDAENFVRPSVIRDYLNDFVIGQEEAKRVLAVAIYNHLKRMAHNAHREEGQPEIEKSNVLMVGPTGSGKTYLLRKVAELIDIPMIVADASSMTAAGYVGSDPEIMLRQLLQAADGDLERAQRGIIYIDEIDKLGRKSESASITRDVSGESVQQQILKILEGTKSQVPIDANRLHPGGNNVEMDTSNILFVVGGSFEGIEEIIKKRLGEEGRRIGFDEVSEAEQKKKDFNHYILEVEAEDLRKFGMIPELLGRLPVVVPLQELDVDALTRILTEPQNALLKQYSSLLSYDGADIEFSDEAVKAIAEIAYEKKTGARSLRSVLEKVLLPHMFNLPDEENDVTFYFDEETIRDGKAPKRIVKESK